MLKFFFNPFWVVLGTITSKNDVILVVEDNPSVLFNMKLSLEMNGYKILTAENGNQALKILVNSAELPNLILSDIMMPEMDGYELLEKVSKLPNLDKIPFIFISAKSDPEDIRLGRLLGADDYLTKPVDEELLLSILKKKLRGSKLLEIALASHFGNKFGYRKINDAINYKNRLHIPENVEKSCLFKIEGYDTKISPEIERIGEDFISNIDLYLIQLYTIMVSFFHLNYAINLESSLINLENIHSKAVVIIDKLNDNTNDSKDKFIMLGFVTREISFYQSLKVKKILFDLLGTIKNGSYHNLSISYIKILNISN